MIWLASVVLLVLGLAASGITFYLVVSAQELVNNDPQVRQARDNWLYGSRPGGFLTYDDARRQAEARLFPSRQTRAIIFFIALGVTVLLALCELIAFGLMLSWRGVQTNFRWYALTIVTWLVGLVVAGASFGGIFFLINRAENAPEVRQAREDERRMHWDQPRELRDQAYRRIRDAERTAWARVRPLLTIAIALLVAAAVLHIRAMFAIGINFAVLLYKLWQHVQDGRAQATPGQAVGFLFIPFFNLYWAFIALPGLADELNRCAHRRRLDIAPASRGLFLTYVILCLVAAVPFIGILAVLINVVVAIAAFRSATRVAVALAEQE